MTNIWPRVPGGSDLVSRINTYELAFRMQAEAPEPWICPRSRRRLKTCTGLDASRPTSSGATAWSPAGWSNAACALFNFTLAAAT
jgi:hypothetical protein